MEELKVSQKEQKVKELFWDFVNLDYSKCKEFEYKINAFPLMFNIFQDCEREQLVSFFQMIPIFERSVPIEEADYILYANPYARVEDFTDSVLEELEEIDEVRKKDSEIIICGKATNIRDILKDKYQSITYVDSHYAEYLGQRFNLPMKEKYVVYDDRDCTLNIWPVDGCLNKCGFCRRTYMNIPFETQPIDKIKDELDWYKENHPEKMKVLRLRAENLTECGYDLGDNHTLDKYIDLVDSYDEVKEIKITIGMCIGEINDKILSSLCRTKKITFIALNIEAGSDRLLKVIGKNHTCDDIRRIVKTLYAYHPNLYISTTAMIGLPTETIEDILALGDLILECGFGYFHCNYYEYSPKHPIARYEQLNDQIRELHLRYLIRYIKKNFDEKYKAKYVLKMRHESIKDKGKRSVMRELEELKERQKYRKARQLMVTNEYFVGDDISIRSSKNSLSYDGMKNETKRIILAKKKCP